eukprot:TRINITY_DN5314_c0_g1_i1.p1 TRINITY_DN5314_c0_g1~~TRINITY_DN5314_c0_g1_i1.p1  ORF type:complete len:517 (+),score=107.60 TRINITY_DN5314_c0_g1_i1:127-1677(+)
MEGPSDTADTTTTTTTTTTSNTVEKPLEDEPTTERGGAGLAGSDGGQFSSSGSIDISRRAGGGKDGGSGETATASSADPKKKGLPRETDYEWTKVLGKGSFGKVRLGTLKTTGQQYAVKVIKKSFIMKQHKNKEVVFREREILHLLDKHPLIVTLHYTFQNSDSLFFVMDYCPNGELFDIISKLGSLSVECTRFYAAEMLVALEYIHEKGVIHRDFKPENILLTSDNHIKVIDFGTAKKAGRERASSFEGTPEYMSPEAVSTFEGGSADYRCDLWSLGVIIYRCLTGQLPFKDPGPWETMRRIRELDFVWPAGFHSEAQDLCKKLLVPEAQRIGEAEIRAHPFFAGIEWDKLTTTTPPPFAALETLPTFPQRQLTRTSSQSTVEEERERSASTIERASAEAAEGGEDADGAKLERILNSGEKVVRMGIVSKRRRLMNVKRRQLILTDEPRLVYIDPATMRLMGTIPFSSILVVNVKDSSHFVIKTQGRDYWFESKKKDAHDWVKAINNLLPTPGKS